MIVEWLLRVRLIHEEDDDSTERYGVDDHTVSSPTAYTNTNPFQDVQYESLESVYRLKPFVPRRESP
ncbi:BnaC01g24320D [Brassica napus]|uniref:BnaC01g24320D protein n=1 Tax=Brassica napus TaxID=3708 RepID=A0A078GEF7_BRANA|nr:BnaC01g24320D [Brassica napus]